MASPFLFYTVFAFNVFLKENVDVAVMEVGIGGLHDATNVLRCPTVCAVTSIGVDHVSKLGDTEATVAWYKSGLFKVYNDNNNNDDDDDDDNIIIIIVMLI